MPFYYCACISDQATGEQRRKTLRGFHPHSWGHSFIDQRGSFLSRTLAPWKSCRQGCHCQPRMAGGLRRESTEKREEWKKLKFFILFELELSYFLVPCSHLCPSVHVYISAYVELSWRHSKNKQKAYQNKTNMHLPLFSPPPILTPNWPLLYFQTLQSCSGHLVPVLYLQELLAVGHLPEVECFLTNTRKWDILTARSLEMGTGVRE